MTSLTRVQSSSGSKKERREIIEKDEPLFCDEDIDRVVFVLNRRDGVGCGFGGGGGSSVDVEEMKRMQKSMEEMKSSNEEMKSMLIKLLAQANQSG
ncbi:hypothetical protein EON65_40700 [archaeon]|nr:MAG: hypothetical protein EON65_40700 [archaeon]